MIDVSYKRAKIKVGNCIAKNWMRILFVSAGSRLPASTVKALISHYAFYILQSKLVHLTAGTFDVKSTTIFTSEPRSIGTGA